MSARARVSLLLAKGALIGMSDSVPGVSGGTVAVLLGIYDRLIAALAAINLKTLRLLLRGEPVRAWSRIDGGFLLTLAIGMLGGLLISANTVLFALEHAPIALGGFFMGLVGAALLLLRSEYRLSDPRSLFCFVLGVAGVVGVGLLQPGGANDSALFLFAAGVIAISAMLLPGLSGAFLLIVLGVYEPMLKAVVDVNIPVLATFGAGCAVGLLAFARLLSWLLSAYRRLTYSLIGGLLLGSLSVIWPWRLPRDAASGAASSLAPVWPADYAAQSGAEPALLAALVSCAVGLLLVAGLHQLFTRAEAASQ